MKRLTLVALLISALSLSLRFGISTAYAARKVDCGQVMSELSSGKKVAEVAKDMKISERSVNGCRKRAKMESKTGGGMGTMASPGAMKSPAATR
jgi:hypothetical protein